LPLCVSTYILLFYNGHISVELDYFHPHCPNFTKYVLFDHLLTSCKNHING
jgi:hypothetical protein